MTTVRHRMIPVNNFPSGAMEWHCPFCDRRMIFGGEPYQWTVINRGDQTISHYGSTVGLEISGVALKINAEDN